VCACDAEADPTKHALLVFPGVAPVAPKPARGTTPAAQAAAAGADEGRGAAAAAPASDAAAAE
jgi:hypothetical protein